MITSKGQYYQEAATGGSSSPNKKDQNGRESPEGVDYSPRGPENEAE